MRGALKTLPGIAKVDIRVGVGEFGVSYDPGQVTPERILAALEAEGEGVRLAP